MILRYSHFNFFLTLSFLLCFAARIVALDPNQFDCHLTLDDRTKFDLTSLSGEHIVNRTRETPPSNIVDSLRFDLCGELKSLPEFPEHDQCPAGTKACLTKTIKKSEHLDLISAVIPIAQLKNLEPKIATSSTPKFVNIVLHGAEYPTLGSTSPVRQSLNLTVICTPEGSEEPKFIAYDGARLDIEWNSPAGCPFREHEGGDKNKGDGKDGDHGDKPKDDAEEEKNVGSGIGWFFLALLLAFLAYFGLGAYYNYSTYGASGLDLIPHRDFWKEVPYMLSDVMSHLCSNVRPRRTSSRGGYIAV